MALRIVSALVLGDSVPRLDLARLKQVFGLEDADLSAAIGLLGPGAYVLGYLVIYNTGVDASMSDGEVGIAWTVGSAAWMLGLPLAAIPGVILGVRARRGRKPLAAAAGVVLNSIWLLAWSYLLFLLVSGASV
jgi:hypothetical protein